MEFAKPSLDQKLQLCNTFGQAEYDTLQHHMHTTYKVPC